MGDVRNPLLPTSEKDNGDGTYELTFEMTDKQFAELERAGELLGTATVDETIVEIVKRVVDKAKAEELN